MQKITETKTFNLVQENLPDFIEKDREPFECIDLEFELVKNGNYMIYIIHLKSDMYQRPRTLTAKHRDINMNEIMLASMDDAKEIQNFLFDQKITIDHRPFFRIGQKRLPVYRLNPALKTLLK